MANNSNSGKSNRGFASMSESRQKEIASKGGKASSGGGNKRGSNQGSSSNQSGSSS